MKKWTRIAMVLCAVAGFASLAMLVPQFRDMIIDMGERYIGRPLTHRVWHGKLVRWAQIFVIFDATFLVVTALITHAPVERAEKSRIRIACGTSFIAMPDFAKWLGISAVVFIVAHGYCFFNALYNHDSLLIFQHHDIGMVSLGRFFRPIYSMLFRGRITAPWLIGCISFVFIMASAYLILKLFNIRGLRSMCIVTAMLATATTLTLTNATYIHDSDAYMLALLLAVFGAYITIKHSRYSVVSVICMSLSMGLYQSYIQVAVALLMFDVFADVLKDKGAKDIVKKSLIYSCSIIAAFALYWMLVKLFQFAYKVPMSDDYNGMAKVGQYGGFHRILSCFTGTYKYVLRAFVHPLGAHKMYALFVRFALFFVGTWAICSVIVKSRLSKINVLFAVLLICLFPFGLNVVYFITQGMEHDLMTFSFEVVPLLVLPLMGMAKEVDEGTPLKTAKILVYGCFAVMVFGNIIFANQTYVKKDLEAKSTLSVVTRIIDRIEQTEGYVAGETEVCIVGRLERNPLVVGRRAGFSYDGTGNGTWVTATYNIEHYISYYLAYPYKMHWGQCPADISERLGVFPAKNCVAIKDGVLYIRIGN